jgi:hypothetical protein
VHISLLLEQQLSALKENDAAAASDDDRDNCFLTFKVFLHTG